MEIVNKYKIKEVQMDVIEHVIEYTSGQEIIVPKDGSVVF
jgi:hypothetical protein